MVQDITPNNNSAVTNTNTMSPRTISAQSAGSTTPTIISQSNADRRRRAIAEKNAKRRENLASNVAKAEVEKEYKRLREAEEAANKRAEERKAAANREKVKFYAGGRNSDLQITETTIGKYLGDQLKGAQAPVADPTEYNQFQAMGNQGDTQNYDAAYAGLEKLAESVNKQLEQEAKEKRLIENARSFATLTGLSVINQGSSYTPMTVEAKEAHLRLIENPTTDMETRQRLMDDLKLDYQKGGEVTGAEQNRLMNIALSSTAPKDAKSFAFNYLGEIGSTIGKSDFNKSADAIYVSQYEKNRQSYLDRSKNTVYDIQPDTSSPRAIEENRKTYSEVNAKTDNSLNDNTRKAILANQTGANEALTALNTARLNALEAGDVGVTGYIVDDRNDPNYGKFRPDKNGNLVQYSIDPEEERVRAAQDNIYERQNAEVQARQNENPNYVESIQKVSDGNKLDLSSDAFFREQAATEREYGNTDWTSAGGETANRAKMEGRDSSSYSRFKAAPDSATDEYILISNDGKQRYTLRTSDRGGRFAIYGWTGDIVAEGDSAEGLPSALKRLNIPFNEDTFNPYVPDADDSRVMLEDETDLGDMEETPAMFKSKQLGTYRTNEEIRNAEFDRRDAVDKSIRDGINDYFNGIQEMKDGLDEALAKNDENYQRSIVGNDYFNGIKGLKDGLDEALAKNDEDYQRTIAELTAPPDESAMARKMRFEGYTDKDQESLISTVNRMKAAQGMSGGAMPMPGFAGGFAGEDTFGGVADGDIGDEGFDEGGFDEEDFPGGIAGGEDFAEEIPDDNNFGRAAKSNFGGVNSGDLFGGAFGKNPKNFGKSSSVFESPAEFGEDTDFGEVADFGDNIGQKSESGMGGVFKTPSVNIAESKRSQSPEPWEKFDATQTKSPFMSTAQTSRDLLTLKNRDLSAVPKYTERDHTVKERMKTISDQMDLDKQMEDIYTRIGLLSEGGTDESGRAVAGLYPSTKKYAETVDELVKSGALISDDRKRESLYSDAENPDKNIDAYTNLRWSSRATPDIMDRFKQVEENMNKASEDLNAEYKKLSEKYKEKEQLDKDIYLGIPYTAKESVHSILPDPKYVKPTLNTIDYMSPITLPIRLTHDKIGNTWDEIWGAPPKNIFTEDYWKEKIYDSPPLLYSLFDYDDFYKDPVGYGAEYAASYALTGGIGAAVRAGGKAAPRVYHTVIDPLNNSELKKKSLKYIEDFAGNLPKMPIGVQYSIVNLPAGQAKSLSVVRHMDNMDVVHPITTVFDSKITNKKEWYLGDPKFDSPWSLLLDTNTGLTKEAFIPKSGIETAYVRGAVKGQLKKIDKDPTIGALYGFKDNEEYKKSLQNAINRFSIVTDLNKHLQHARPVAIQSLEPHVQKVITAKDIFKFPKKVSKAIVETMNEFKVHSQSSLTQFGQGWEFGGGGLSRNPNDFDLFTKNPKEFVETLTKRINDIEGREVVFVKGDKILFKDTGDEFFDAHSMGQFGSDGIFSGMGVKTELPVKIGDTDVTTTTMAQQNINKETALFNFTTPKSYPKFPEAFGEGKPGVGWVQPRKEDRAKDLKDFAFGALDQINQMLSSKVTRERKEGLKALKAFNKFLKTYGDEAYDEIMKDYTHFKKLHGGVTKPFEGEVIRVDKFGLNSSPEQGEKAINAAKQKFKKDPQVVDILEIIRKNLNANTIVGVPLGLFMTAAYIQSVATRIANNETTPQKVMSKEIMPMLVGAKLSGKTLIKFDEWNAFRKRDRYIPPTVLADWDIISGARKFPSMQYDYDNPKMRKEFIDMFGKEGGAWKRIENEGVDIPDNVKMAGIRVQSQPSDQIRKNVIEIKPTSYKEGRSFSGSISPDDASLHFARTEDYPDFTKDEFSWNLIPATYKPPIVYNTLSTREVGEVPFGMGRVKTEEYIKEHLRPDQYAAISAKTAEHKKIWAEKEGTIRPYAQLQILDNTGYTIHNNKRVAVDTLGMIPYGAKETDVKINVINKGYDPKKEVLHYEPIQNILDDTRKVLKDLAEDDSFITAAKAKNELPLLKKRVSEYKQFMKKQSKTIQENHEFDILLAEKMYGMIDKNIKKVNSWFIPKPSYLIQKRTPSGNPFAASPLYTFKKEDKSKETYKNPFDFDYKMPDFFSPNSPSSVKNSKKSTTTSLRTTTKKSPPSVPSRPSIPSTPSVPSVPSIITSLTSTPPTKKSPPSVPSKPPVPSTPSVPSVPSRPPTKSPPSVPSKPPVIVPPTTKTPPSKPPVIVPPTTKTPPTKKKTPKRVPWDNPHDKKRRTDYNIFNLENTEIPIVRGWEALTGIDTPTYELPANRQTFYQVGNTLTKTKPKSLKEKKPANKQTKKGNKKNPVDDDFFNMKNMGFDGFDVLTGTKTKTVKQSANKPTLSLFGNTQTKKKPATKQTKKGNKKSTWINPFEMPKDFKF